MLLHIKAIERRLKIAGDRKITIGSVVLDYDSFTVNVMVRRFFCHRRNLSYFIFFCPIPEEYIQGSSLWMRYGVQIRIQAGRL